MTTTLQQLNDWLTSDRSTEMPNLSGANLSRANLPGATLSGANLSGATLYRADLFGATLSRANLYVANLSRANLSRANLSRADLFGADLSRANLSGANLSGTKLNYCIGNNEQILTVQLGLFTVVICGETVAIGCRQYTVSEWEAMSDEQLNHLDPRATAWKADNIDIIRTMLNRQPRLSHLDCATYC